MKKQIKNIKTILAALTMLTVTSCADEDLMPNVGQAGQLHIASVGVGDNKVASRNGEAEGTTSIVIPDGYNEVVTEVSSLTLKYTFAKGENLDKTATAKYDKGWTIDGNILQPSAAGEKWENLKIEATNITSAGFIKLNEEPWSGADNLYVYKDKVSATSIGDGGITVDTDVASAYLGKMTITLSHDHALLSLAQDKYIVESGTYIKDDNTCQVTALDILWAELSNGQSTIYVPLTTGTNCLQAIVPVDYKLTGFRAVMKNDESKKFYLDFGVSQELLRNTQYNLKLTITPNYQGIELQQTVRPGWDTGSDLIDWKQSAGLKYNAQTKTFEVSDAKGLLLLNLWMTGNGDEIKHIEGYSNIDKTASRMSHNIKITNDIDFGAEHRIFDLDGNGDNMSNWKPLGDSGNEYTGTFDGNGKTITGLAIFTNNGIAGLADRLGEGGVIKNLTISEATVSTNLDHTGIVAAYTAGIIENCKVVSSSVTGSGDWVGAIAGSNLGTIIACQVSGTGVEGLIHVAGIAGSNSGNVVACSTSSNLTLTATNTAEPKIAGLVSDNKGKVYGSWTTKVNNSGGTGNGVCSNNTHVYNCFAASTIDEAKVGENAGEGTMNYAIALYNQTLASGADDPAYCNWHWATTNDDNIQLTSGAPTATFSLTYVSETRTFQVYDAAGLQLVTEWMWKGRPVSDKNQTSGKFADYTIYYNAANPDGDPSTDDDVDTKISSIPGFDSSMNKNAVSYTNGNKTGTAILDRFTYNIKLMNDITFGDNDKIYNLNKQNDDPNKENNNDSNFLYIAGDNCSFSGTIDGNGKKITGLIIDSDRSQTGLVDVMAADGVIKNLTLINAYVTASADDTGMFVSANSGIVSNCHVNGGTVHGEDGGIAVFIGSHGGTGIIENCSAENVSIYNKSYKDKNTGINEDVNLAGIAGRGSGKINKCSVIGINFHVTQFISSFNFYVGNIAGNSGEVALVVTESTSNTCKIWKNNDEEGTTYNSNQGQVVFSATNDPS